MAQNAALMQANISLKHDTHLFSFDVVSIKVTPLNELTGCHSNSLNSVLVRSNISFKQSMLLLKILHTS